MKSIPQFTQTGTPITMPAMTFTAPGSSSTINAGTGWYKANDASHQAYAAISGWVSLACLHRFVADRSQLRLPRRVLCRHRR
jgi:hypothetical protein